MEEENKRRECEREGGIEACVVMMMLTLVV